jgi:hypothetical protein
MTASVCFTSDESILVKISRWNVMFVQVCKGRADGAVEILVLGEQLAKDQDGAFLLPGRLVSGLKTEDLPEDICFKLLDQLPSGMMFYREDNVMFRRRSEHPGMEVLVTTTYAAHEWDGLFSLQSTMEARRCVIANSEEYTLRNFQNEGTLFLVSFSFTYGEIADHDLEQVLESICDKVRWVEEKGNERLIFGRLF